MIQKMLDMQKNLMVALNLDYLTDEPLRNRLDTVNYLLTCISSEVEETRKELPWKHWKKYERYTPDNLKIGTETIDIFHFLLEIWLVLGMSERDIVRLYHDKYKENLKRWANDGRITKEQYYDALKCR